MPFFAAAGGLLACLHIPLLLALPNDPSPTEILLLTIYAAGLMPWPMTGVLFGYFANKSGADLSEARNRAVFGARAGAASIFSLATLFSLVVVTGMPDGEVSESASYLVPLLLAGMGLLGAVHGALSAALVGRFTLEKRVIPKA